MRIISYLRVSTARQGMSGLGLEAQRSAVAAFAMSGGHDLISEYVEVESGKKVDRPQLAAALSACRLHRATLAIAKLDRLARNVAFIANLMDGGVEFVACDMPHASRLTLHLMAAMAEYERDMISQRTMAALAAAKVRGVKLGNPQGAVHLHAGCKRAAAASAVGRRSAAITQAASVVPSIIQLQEQGVASATALARALNIQGVPAPSGGIWYAQQVRKVVRMAAADV